MIDDILAEAESCRRPAFTLAHSQDGYSTNIPTADLIDGKAMIATHYEGQPLIEDHGGPARLLVPHLYFWKSAKWLNAFSSPSAKKPASGSSAATTCMAIPGVNSDTAMTEPVAEPSGTTHWQTATVVEIVAQTQHIKSFFLCGRPIYIPCRAARGPSADCAGRIQSRSQLLDCIRPRRCRPIELAIERLDGGEVSPFFHDVVAVGDEVELRGPLGGHFIWSSGSGGPLLLIGGGSGVVPLVAMIRHRVAAADETPVVLLLSARTWDEVPFLDTLLTLHSRQDGFVLVLTLTREAPRRAGDYGRRIDVPMISEVLTRLPSKPQRTFVCGSNAFVNVAADGGNLVWRLSGPRKGRALRSITMFPGCV